MAYRTENSPAPAAVAEEVKPQQPVNRTDNHIWGVYCFIVALSVVELYSASSFEIAKQGLYAPLIRHVGFLLAGLLLILGIQRVHYRYFAPVSRGLALISCLAMVYVMFFGSTVNGAKRAISLGFMSLQPAEFIKLSAVLMVALILSTTQLKKDPRQRNIGLAKASGVILLMSGLLFTQGLTNTIILMVISISMLLLGAFEWRKLFIVFAVYAVFGGCAAGVKMMMADKGDAPVEAPELVDSRGQRYTIPEAASTGRGDSRMADDTWLNRIKHWQADSVPKYEQPITAKNIQEMRSYMAQANGGWFGVHPGNSRETARLPLAFSDYIYAIIVEDLGLAGGILVMVLYLWLLARAYVIARQCNQMYPAFLITGCAVLITVQALCHMAIVSGAGPVSGQPLPLFSKGGTSILVTSIAFGVMLSVSRYSVRSGQSTSRQLREEAESLPEDLRVQNPSRAS